MANAIRSRTIQKGIDPRGFSLVAFGGAGPLHGAEVAAMLEIPEVIVPVYPGITSALGLLTTDLKYDAIKTEFQVRGSVDLAGLNEDFRAMEAGLAGQFTADGLAPSEVSFTRWADLRYVGQGYELRVAMPAGAVDPAGLEGAWQRFHELHHAEYGQSFPSSPIEIVNIRVSGVGRMPRIGALRTPRGTSLDGRPRQDRPVRVPRERRARAARHRLLPARPAARRRGHRRPRHHPPGRQHDPDPAGQLGPGRPGGQSSHRDRRLP